MSHVVIAVIFLVSLTLSVLALLVLTRDGSKSSRSLPGWSAGLVPPPRPEARKSEPATTPRERTATAPRTEPPRPTSVPGMGHLPEKRILREARTLVEEIEQFLEDESRLT